MSEQTLKNEPAGARLPEGKLLTVLALSVIAASCLLVLSFDYGRDQAIYALVAREMSHGGAPYRDAFDFKPPGIFFLYALSRLLFGASMWGIRVLEVLSMLASAWAMVRLSTRHFGGRAVGLCAAAIASQIHAQLDFWHTAQPESFGATLTLYGLLAASYAFAAQPGRRRLFGWVLCGVLFGASGLMKPPLSGVGALLGVALGVGAIVRARRTSQRPTLRAVLADPLAVALGGVLPFALTALYFISKGALADLHEVLFVFTPHYTKISWENASVLAMAYYGIAEWLTTYSSTLLAGLICLAVLGARGEERRASLVLLGAISVHITGIVMQAKFFQYHWGATFPLTAMLAALGLVKAYRLVRARGALAAAGFLLLAVIVASAKMPVPSFGETFFARSRARLALFLESGGPDKRARWDAFASVADVDAAENRSVGRFVAEHTEPNQPVYVWGFECAIYDFAERPLASRYIYNVPQRATWSAEPMQAALMRDLALHPPAAIVVEHGDVFSFVTGNNLDSAGALRQFPALRELLTGEFYLAESIGDADVYLRRSE